MTRQKSANDTQTAGEHVYQYLRSSIMQLQIKPGQTININELSTFLQVSRSPIRDALVQLARDGLVTTTPQKSTIVSKIDIPRAHDERFMRACVEEKVLAEFIDCHQPSDMAALEDSLTRQKLKLEAKDIRGFLKEDDGFHSIFFIATNHPFSMENTLNMSGHYYRIRLLALSSLDICDQSYRQHQTILQMIRDKDYANVWKMINLHVVEKRDEETRMRRKYPDLFTDLVEADPVKPKIWEDDFLMTI